MIPLGRIGRCACFGQTHRTGRLESIIVVVWLRISGPSRFAASADVMVLSRSRTVAPSCWPDSFSGLNLLVNFCESNQGPPVGRRRTIIRTPATRRSDPPREVVTECSHPQAASRGTIHSQSSRTMARAGGRGLGPRSRPAFPAATSASRTTWIRSRALALVPSPNAVAKTSNLLVPGRRLANRVEGFLEG